MMLSCKLCGDNFSSDLAGVEGRTLVIDQLLHHLTRQHKQDIGELAAKINATGGYLAVRMFGEVPNGETDLRAGLADTERDLFAILSGDVVTRLREVMRGGQGGTN